MARVLPRLLVWLAVVRAASNEDDEELEFKVDSSAEGCTGLFWREWDASRRVIRTAQDQHTKPWPRNGAVVRGLLPADHPGYLLLADGHLLPFHDSERHYTYLHPVLKKETGLLQYAALDASKTYDVAVVGSGPAGLTAAIYVARNARSVVCVGGPHPGGAMMSSELVENFPSMEAAPGAKILGALVRQAQGFGTQFQEGAVKRVTWDASSSTPNRTSPVRFKVELEGGNVLHSQSVIVAAGAVERWLGLPGEERLRGKSLHVCAYCDARFYEGKEVCVIGGGDGALEAVRYLARLAKSVVLIHRRETWRGSAVALARVRQLPAVRIMQPYTVEAWRVEAGKLVGASLRHASSGDVQQVACTGAFISIGRQPQTSFLSGDVHRDARGFLLAAQHTMAHVPGLFVAGQVADGRYQQAVTAAGSGAQAGMDAGRWLDGDFGSGEGDQAAGLPQQVRMRGASSVVDIPLVGGDVASAVSVATALSCCCLLALRLLGRPVAAAVSGRLEQCPKLS